MKKIKLTQGKYALVDDQDFEWLSQWKWFLSSSGYAVRNPRDIYKGSVILLHRLIMDTPQGLDTDHINRNRLDNRRINLRIATRGENNINSKISVRNSSGHKGIYWDRSRNKWQAYIGVKSKLIHLGRFVSKEDAIRAYQEAAQQHYGGFMA